MNKFKILAATCFAAFVLASVAAYPLMMRLVNQASTKFGADGSVSAVYDDPMQTLAVIAVFTVVAAFAITMFASGMDALRKAEEVKDV